VRTTLTGEVLYSIGKERGERERISWRGRRKKGKVQRPTRKSKKEKNKSHKKQGKKKNLFFFFFSVGELKIFSMDSTPPSIEDNQVLNYNSQALSIFFRISLSFRLIRNGEKKGQHPTGFTILGLESNNASQ
jgi:hypothetical protein